MQNDNQQNKFQCLKLIDLFGKRVNLRFQGDDYYKTYCGAFATIIMFVSLIGLFTISAVDIVRGKIDKMNYLIKNTEQNTTSSKHFTIAKETFGFAIESAQIDDRRFLEYYVAMTGIRGNFKDGYKLKFYNCSKNVYENLSSRFTQDVPTNLTIWCVDAPTELLKIGFMPTIYLDECIANQTESELKLRLYKKDKSETKRKTNCASQALRDTVLKEFYVWAFSLVDESDFTLTKPKFSLTYTASLISVSNLYKKRSKVTLREVEIETNKGLILQRKTKDQTTMFLQNIQEIVSVDKSDPIILELRLDLDDVSMVSITKTYKSLLDLCAFLGGFSKGVGIILLILVFPVREVLFYRKLMNHMFSVCLDKSQIQIAMSLSQVMGEDDDDETSRFQVDDNLHGVSGGRKGEKGAPGDPNNPKKTKDAGVVKRRRRKKLKRSTVKAQLNKFKNMIKKDSKSDTGLIEAMASTYLTKDKMFDNLKDAFERPDRKHRPSTFTDLIKAGFGKKNKKKLREDMGPRDNFEGGDFSGRMLELREDELEVMNVESVKEGIAGWIAKVRENRELRKMSLMQMEESLEKEIEWMRDEEVERKERDEEIGRAMKRLTGLGDGMAASKEKLSVLPSSSLKRGTIDSQYAPIAKKRTLKKTTKSKKIQFFSSFLPFPWLGDSESSSKFFNSASGINLSFRNKSFFGVKSSSKILHGKANPEESVLSVEKVDQLANQSASIFSCKVPKLDSLDLPMEGDPDTRPSLLKRRLRPTQSQIERKKQKSFLKDLKKSHIRQQGLLGEIAHQPDTPSFAGGGGDSNKSHSNSNRSPSPPPSPTKHMSIRPSRFKQISQMQSHRSMGRVSQSNASSVRDTHRNLVSGRQIGSGRSVYMSSRFISDDERSNGESEIDKKIRVSKQVLKESEEEELKKLCENNKEKFRRSEKLKFYVGFFDYIRLFLPGFLDRGYSKRDIYLEVSLP